MVLRHRRSILEANAPSLMNAVVRCDDPRDLPKPPPLNGASDASPGYVVHAAMPASPTRRQCNHAYSPHRPRSRVSSCIVSHAPVRARSHGRCASFRHRSLAFWHGSLAFGMGSLLLVWVLLAWVLLAWGPFFYTGMGSLLLAWATSFYSTILTYVRGGVLAWCVNAQVLHVGHSSVRAA
jgi:hypothetical protein